MRRRNLRVSVWPKRSRGKVSRGELLEQHASRIGRQIMRENALELFPKLRRMLWRSDAE